MSERQDCIQRRHWKQTLLDVIFPITVSINVRWARKKANAPGTLFFLPGVFFSMHEFWGDPMVG